MDGVSAALGVASFADVLIRTVVEIHAFYNSIKDAPQTVTIILADLELLKDVLQDFGSLERFPERSDSVTLNKARILCNIKVRNLVGIVDKLKRGFDSQGKSAQVWARKSWHALVTQETISSSEQAQGLSTVQKRTEDLLEIGQHARADAAKIGSALAVINEKQQGLLNRFNILADGATNSQARQSSEISSIIDSLRAVETHINVLREEVRAISNPLLPPYLLAAQDSMADQALQKHCLNGIYGNLSAWQDLVRLFDDYIEYGYGSLESNDVVGWESTLLSFLSLKPVSESDDLGLRDEFVQWVLSRNHRTILKPGNEWILSFIVSLALGSLDFLSFELICAAEPQLFALHAMMNQTQSLELLSEFHIPKFQNDRPTSHFPRFSKEALQLLCRYRQGLQVTRSGETAISEGLWFSHWFRRWRDWLGEELDTFLESELKCSDSRFARDKWQLHTLRLLFELAEFSVFDRSCLLRAEPCSTGNCQGNFDGISIFDDILLIEPCSRSVERIRAKIELRRMRNVP
ncbi:MAG: hypothetical protein Q9165_007799 [Trypethelium subeluteriae]